MMAEAVGYGVMMRKIVFIFLVAVIAAGCHNEPQLQYRTRYEQFRQLLNRSEDGFFCSYSFKKAAASFRARIAAGKVDLKKLEAVKAREDIENLNADQIMRYFGGAMYARVLYYRFISFLNDEELVEFNRYNLLAVARSLSGRFAENESELRDYDKNFPKRAPLGSVLKREMLLRLSQEGLSSYNPAGRAAVAATVRFLWKKSNPGFMLSTAPELKKLSPLVAAGAFHKAATVYAGPEELFNRSYRKFLPAITSYRLLAFIAFMRDVVDEKVDFFGEDARRRLLLLL